MSIERKYSDRVRSRAVARVIERRKSEPNNRAVVREVATEMGVGEQSLRNWLSRMSDGELVASPASHVPGSARAAGRREDLGSRVAALEEENRALRMALVVMSRELAAASAPRLEASA